MALSIMENKNSLSWSTKKSIIVAVISLIIGIIIFSIAFISVTQNTGIIIINQPILSWIIENRHNQITYIMQIITESTNPYFLISLVIIISSFWAIKKREILRPLLLILSIGISTISFTLIKIITSINRPPQDIMILPLKIDYSFPSGHTISIFVVLMILGYLVFSRRSGVIRIIMWVTSTALATILVGLSRLYLGYHWATDLIGAIGLGLIIFALIIFIDKLIANKFKNLK